MGAVHHVVWMTVTVHRLRRIMCTQLAATEVFAMLIWIRIQAHQKNMSMRSSKNYINEHENQTVGVGFFLFMEEDRRQTTDLER